jgi:hypothetical protein
VTAEDAPDRQFRANSPSGAWKLVLEELTAKNAGSANTHASGPDLFGLSVRNKTMICFKVFHFLARCSPKLCSSKSSKVTYVFHFRRISREQNFAENINDIHAQQPPVTKRHLHRK